MDEPFIVVGRVFKLDFADARFSAAAHPPVGDTGTLVIPLLRWRAFCIGKTRNKSYIQRRVINEAINCFRMCQKNSETFQQSSS
jgi:hypothetical protein